MNKNRKLNQLYAGQKAAITRRYNRNVWNCACPASIAAHKTARTRALNKLNQLFGRWECLKKVRLDSWHSN